VGSAIEDGSASDQTLIEALAFRHFSLVNFLLFLAVTDKPEASKAVQCLAVSGNVYELLWMDYMCNNEKHVICLTVTLLFTVLIANHFFAISSTNAILSG
jgi:hypothetical protein